VYGALCGIIVDDPQVPQALKDNWGIDITLFLWRAFFVIAAVAVWLVPFFVSKKNKDPRIRRINGLLKRVRLFSKLHRKEKLTTEESLRLLTTLVRVESRTMIRVLFTKTDHDKFIESVETAYKSDGTMGAITAAKEFLLSLKTKCESK
jgi:hypothetical protein